GAPDDLEPFARLVVAAFDEFDPEHRKFARIPTADDVQPGAAATDVIDGRERLGGVKRMQNRDVNGHEKPDPRGGGGQPRGPSERFRTTIRARGSCRQNPSS